MKNSAVPISMTNPLVIAREVLTGAVCRHVALVPAFTATRERPWSTFGPLELVRNGKDASGYRSPDICHIGEHPAEATSS